ncbi:MAG TPA: thioredoxin fold domain-containing protein [Spirochaetota bacterium]
MKKAVYYLAVMFLALSAFPARGAWVGFNEGSKVSHETGKLMIVDFSTSWCIWCKKMDKEVFSNKDIAARLAREFVTVRVDAESATPLTYKGKTMETRQFTVLAGVEGYPTLIVFDPKGTPVASLNGFVDATIFGVYLDYLAKGEYRKQSFEDYYKAVMKKSIPS